MEAGLSSSVSSHQVQGYFKAVAAGVPRMAAASRTPGHSFSNLSLNSVVGGMLVPSVSPALPRLGEHLILM